jgi:hypothetical protein
MWKIVFLHHEVDFGTDIHTLFFHALIFFFRDANDEASQEE